MVSLVILLLRGMFDMPGASTQGFGKQRGADSAGCEKAGSYFLERLRDVRRISGKVIGANGGFEVEQHKQKCKKAIAAEL